MAPNKQQTIVNVNSVNLGLGIERNRILPEPVMTRWRMCASSGLNCMPAFTEQHLINTLWHVAYVAPKAFTKVLICK